MTNRKIILIAVVMIVVILAWAPWLDSQSMRDKMLQRGGRACDYYLVKWAPFGRYGKSCGVEWFVTLWGQIL